MEKIFLTELLIEERIMRLELQKEYLKIAIVLLTTALIFFNCNV